MMGFAPPVSTRATWALWLLLVLLPIVPTVGCRDRDEAAPASARAPAAAGSAPVPSNRIDVPETVRQNLGITFAKVERRRVAATLRVPGRFELLPTARREYRATLPGYARLSVEQFAEVSPGQPIFRLDSPDWHELKRQLHDAEVGIEQATAELAVAERGRAEAEQVAAALQKRVDALAGAETRRAELDVELATRRASIPRLEAEIDVKRAALEEARHDLQINVAKAAALLGVTPQFLSEPEKPRGGGDGDGHAAQRWYGIDQVGLDARAPGLVESVAVTDGSWVEANTLVATTIDPKALRFRAVALQSDLGKLADGLDAQVVPPHGAAGDQAGRLSGKLQIGPVADPQHRTIDLLLVSDKRADWARAGVASFLEIVTDGSAGGTGDPGRRRCA